MDHKKHPSKRTAATLVVIKRRGPKKRRNTIVRGRGLPASKPIIHLEPEQQAGKDNEFDDIVNDSALSAVSFTWMAFESIKCLDIPCSDGSMIRGCLECQLHEHFQKSGGSSTTVTEELDALSRSNRLCQLTSEKVTVFCATTDYVHAVLSESLDDKSGLVAWFVRHLSDLSNATSIIPIAHLQRVWDDDPELGLCFRDALHLLQEYQFLMSANASHDVYQLWLPAWGKTVLPAFLKAQKDAVIFLKQSKYNERSQESMVQRMSSCPIPAMPVLIPWLVSQGFVQRIIRPSGQFLRLAK